MSEQQIGMFLKEVRKKGGKYIKIEDEYLSLDPSSGFIVSNEIISEVLLILDTIMKN